MNYVLLLRGINVGGKHKVSMPLLKESLSQIGFANVSSYINSGNLFLESEWNDSQIIEAINSLFEKEFDFPIPFLLLSKRSYLRRLNLCQVGGMRIFTEKMCFFSYLL